MIAKRLERSVLVALAQNSFKAMNDGTYYLLSKRDSKLFDALVASNEVRNKALNTKGTRLYGESFDMTCQGYCCEWCSSNDANTPGSFCAGSNCGWCHGAHTVYVDNIAFGQGGCDAYLDEEIEETEE